MGHRWGAHLYYILFILFVYQRLDELALLGGHSVYLLEEFISVADVVELSIDE